MESQLCLLFQAPHLRRVVDSVVPPRGSVARCCVGAFFDGNQTQAAKIWVQLLNVGLSVPNRSQVFAGCCRSRHDDAALRFGGCPQPLWRCIAMRKSFAISATLALWLSLGAAQAAIFTVTSLGDADGATCGSPCTLRQAINAANASVGADTINFSVSGTITLGSVLPVITDTLAIDGSGRSVTLSGGGAVQVLQLDAATALALNSLTIANGRSTSVLTAGA
jgi:CSLREA domain-containing protein